MIELPNGYRFDFCCASGALGFDGRGYLWERPLVAASVIRPDRLTVVAKTVTLTPRRGNLRWYAPWRCVRTLPGCGTVNCVGLTNMGLDAWIAGPYRRACEAGRHLTLAPSFRADAPAEARAIAVRTRGFGLPFIEVNGSCPNVPHAVANLADVVAEFRSHHAPLILKLSADQVRPDLIRAVDYLVDGFSVINTVPWGDLHGTRRSPLGRHTGGMAGGISGPAIKPAAIEAVRRLRAMTARPVVGGGGIFTLDDVREFEAAGADAFSLGTVFLHRPWRPRRIVEEYRAARLEVKP